MRVSQPAQSITSLYACVAYRRRQAIHQSRLRSSIVAVASFAKFTSSRSNEDDTSSVLDRVRRRAQSSEILSTEQERPSKIHSKCVAPLFKTHIDDRRIVVRPNPVVDDEDAHRTAVLVGGIVQQVLDATFVTDVSLDGDDVFECCELPDVAVVMCCYSGS